MHYVNIEMSGRNAVAFKVADRVEVIDETIRATVVSVIGNYIRIRTDEGFEMEVMPRDIVKLQPTHRFTVSHTEASEALRYKIKEGAKPKFSKPSPKKEERVPEVDLHLDNLVETTHRMTNYDMLSLQLETAEKELDKAIKNRLQRIIFIHGVGEGVLKSELLQLFKKYPNIAHYDADYRKYGKGATEVYIYANY